MNKKTKKSLMLFWLKQLHKICPGARVIIPVVNNGVKRYRFEKLDIAKAIVRVAKKE